MDKLFGKKPTLKEQMKENDRALRKVNRDVERDRRELEKEEKKLEMEIKKAAKMGNKQVQAVGATSKAMGANVKLAEAMGTTAKTMGAMNRAMNPAQMAKTMQEFDVANTKMSMTEEMMNDALDDILTESGDEEEENAIVSQVLDEIGIEISGKVAEAPSAHKGKVGAETISDKNKMADEEIERMLAQLKA